MFYLTTNSTHFIYGYMVTDMTIQKVREQTPQYWCNKGHDMCCPCCGMVRLKEPLLLIEKSNP